MNLRVTIYITFVGLMLSKQNDPISQYSDSISDDTTGQLREEMSVMGKVVLRHWNMKYADQSGTLCSAMLC